MRISTFVPRQLTKPFTYAALVACSAWLVSYIFLFAPYYQPGNLGGDYTYFLTKLLDEYLYSRNNGWLSPQWFTPSFCAGSVGLPNPQSTYWSIPHLLTALTGPTNAVFITMVLFAAIGGLGLYLLLKPTHSGWPALIAALLFASNGYHVSRMLEGHLGHHVFMLVPLIAWLLTRRSLPIRQLAYWRPISIAALLIAYMIIAAGGPIMPQVMATIVLLLAFSAVMGQPPLSATLPRLALAGLLAALLLGPVLLATLSFMANNPRGWFSLPQFDTLASSLAHGLEIIISPFRDTARLREHLENAQILLQWHEFEYGLTFMPAILITLGLAVRLISRGPGITSPTSGYSRAIPVILLLLLTVLPFLINVRYSPAFEEFVHSIPILGSTSNLFRWFVLPMMTVALLIAVSVKWLLGCSRPQPLVTMVLLAATLISIHVHYAWGIRTEIDSRGITYDNTRVEAAYLQFRKNPAHQISSIGFRADIHRNDSFLDEESAQYCYEAAFGYQLEGLSITTLPGAVTRLVDGRFNMINPACYVYPFENKCRPGARYEVKDEQALLALTSYHPTHFATPSLHRSLAILSVVCLIGIATVLILPMLLKLYASTVSRMNRGS